MTSNMEKVSNAGRIIANIEEATSKVKSTGEAYLSGQMAQNMTGSSKTTTFMEWELTPGLTKEFSLEIGSIIRCTEGEFSLGQMAEDTKESISMTRNTVMVSLYGPMDAATMEHGLMENSMASDITKMLQVKSKKENG